MTPTYTADYVPERSRLTTFFRVLLAIPHFIFIGLWGLAAYVAVVIAWFAILVTGRYPRGLYDFVAGFNRASAAFTGYWFLLTDAYPPFSGDVDGYPVRLRVGPPQERYNRLTVLFRAILAIPVYIIQWALQLVAQLGALLAWVVIVVTGRQPEGLQEMIVLGLSYQARSTAYLCLLSDAYPGLNGPDERPAFSPPTTGT